MHKRDEYVVEACDEDREILAILSPIKFREFSIYADRDSWLAFFFERKLASPLAVFYVSRRRLAQSKQ